nr:MAG: cyclohexanecarboxylate-CoA ligase [Mycolicibacterium hassiacum]
MTSRQPIGPYSPDQIDDFYATGQWKEVNLTDLLRLRAETHGKKVFVTDGVRSMTFAEVFAASQRLALGLHRRGLRAGDRVAVQLPNWAEFVVVTAALARIGAVMVPIMPIYRREEVGHVVVDAGIRMAFAPVGFGKFDYLPMYEDIRRDSPTLTDIVAVRAAEHEHAGLADRDILVLDALLPDAQPAQVDAEIDFRADPDELFVIVYTSGTTSAPKGCMHTFNTYAAGARALTEAFGHTENDVQFGPSPITHTTGLVTSLLLPLLVGAATHLMPSWDPKRAVEEIERYRCTAAVTATTFLQTLIAAAEEIPDADLSSLRVWTCAGSPIPAAVVQNAKKKLPGTTILSLYGRSENLCTTTCTITDDPRRAVTSDGAALPGAEVKIVGPDGLEVPRGTEGDIAYRGPSHMLGYLNNPAETAKLYTSDGFSRSGDLGVMDEDGYVRVTGRIKDIVIRGGMNISAREIEDRLAAHPDLTAVAVVGMPDERLGEKVCCFVVPREGRRAPTVEDLREFLVGQGVAIQKTPERVIAVEALPMTATGKVQKHILRDRVRAELAATGRSYR